MNNNLLYQFEDMLIEDPNVTDDELQMVVSKLDSCMDHNTKMANELIKVLRTIDPKVKLIGGFGRRKGKNSSTNTDIDVQMSVKRTKSLEKRLRDLLQPREFEYTAWVPKGIYFSKTLRFGNVDIFFS